MWQANINNIQAEAAEIEETLNKQILIKVILLGSEKGFNSAVDHFHRSIISSLTNLKELEIQVKED